MDLYSSSVPNYKQFLNISTRSYNNLSTAQIILFHSDLLFLQLITFRFIETMKKRTKQNEKKEMKNKTPLSLMNNVNFN